MKHTLRNCLTLLVIIYYANQQLIAAPSASHTHDHCQTLISSLPLNTLPPGASQLIVVKSLGGYQAKITLCQRQGKIWQQWLPPFIAVIGKGGIAPIGEKKEGDLKTPAGLYPIGVAFGSEPLALKLDYKYITPEDKFIDDVNSKSYNTWVSGKTDAKSYESMLNDLYKIGLVINYNMQPTVAGAGSAIFMHLWISATKPTVGCVAMDEQHLRQLLSWLDKNQRPHILIN